jgi:hypothetical protein
MDVAIPNLEFIRQLIADARQDTPQMDAERLRMLQGTGMGMDAMTQENE